MLIPGLLVALLVGACGDDPNAPIYDTSANPEHFPAAALDLIDGIESGGLDDYDTIVTSFEKLYGEHMELVDVPEWGKVISRFGVRFAHRADSLAVLGISRYYQAAGLYALASYALPNDNRLYSLKEQFDGWRIAVDLNLIPETFLRGDQPVSLHENIELLKQFYLADSTYNLFADNYLVGPLLSQRSPDELKDPSLPTVDLIFLAFAGLIEWQPDTSLARFVDPCIDLVGLHIAPLTEHQYRVEVYFIPREATGADFAVAFRVAVADSTLYTERFGDRNFVPFDFQPLRPVSNWRTGTIEAAVEEIYFEGDPGPIAVGLYLPEANPVVYVPIEGSNSYLALFADSFFPADR
jgi:hypothetical protein